jgi:hypothetical protein
VFVSVVLVKISEYMHVVDTVQHYCPCNEVMDELYMIRC